MDRAQEEVGELERMLTKPEALDEAAQAVGAAGAWGCWTFDRQLWYLRVRSRITQAELARRSAISQARISRLEAGAGDMKMSTLKALWAALGYQPLVLPEPLGREKQGRPRRHRRGNTQDSG